MKNPGFTTEQAEYVRHLVGNPVFAIETTLSVLERHVSGKFVSPDLIQGVKDSLENIKERLAGLDGEDEEFKARFRKLADAWKEATSSSVSTMAMHPSYQQIIGMGPRALPLILAELEREPDHWFWALHSIAGESPVPAGGQGKLPEMAAAWLEWGRQRGLVK